MLVTYRFRLYPTRTQERLMAETLETCRRLYNTLLADRRENGTGFYQEQHSLVARKSDSRYLRAVHSQVLQDVNIRLDKSIEAFFAGLARYPRFKRNGRYNSFTYPQWGGFRIIGNRLKLSKIGSVKVRFHREIVGIDRDVNAAMNILKVGLERAHAEEQPLLVQRRISKFVPRKQEVNSFSRW